MSKCNNCRIEILDETEYCPLCHSVLEKTEEMENTYPDIRMKSKLILFLSNIYLFLAIATESILIGYSIYRGDGFLEAIITGAVLFYIYALIRYAIMGKSNIRWKILGVTMITVGLLIVIDYFIGFTKWSVNYVLPTGILVIDAWIIILMIVNRKNWQSYMMMQLAMVLCSGGVFIAYWLHIMTTPVVAIVALYASILLFLGTVIIGGRRARMELKRRFHI